MRDTRCALVTGGQTGALPISQLEKLTKAIEGEMKQPREEEQEHVEEKAALVIKKVDTPRSLTPAPLTLLSLKRSPFRPYSSKKQIGRASCGESVGQSVSIQVYAESSKTTHRIQALQI